MSKISIIIPACGEKFENLARTLHSIFDNATGEFEVIVGFNGGGFDLRESREFEIGEDSRYKAIFFPENVGIKTNINALAASATGKYIYKSDAHCAFGKGFDEILKADMEEDWIVMPRFKIIKDDWSIQMRDGQEEFYDYFYLCCPFTDPKGFRFKAGGHWKERTMEKLDVLIDETPQIHGSGWFMSKDRFFEMGGFPLQDPYGHAQEPQWLALRNWLIDGKVMVNKNTWYAHLHQNSKDRGYPEDRASTERTYRLTAEHFVMNRANYKHDFDWFVNKFMPMPTWPENWEVLYTDWITKYI